MKRILVTIEERAIELLLWGALLPDNPPEPEAFFDPQCAALYRGILAVTAPGKPVDHEQAIDGISDDETLRRAAAMLGAGADELRKGLTYRGSKIDGVYSLEAKAALETIRGRWIKHLARKIAYRPNGGSMVRLYDFGKNGRREVAIVTDCSDEGEFLRKLAEQFCVSEQALDPDAAAQCFARAADIICKLRGYKNDVKERRLLLAGDVWPAEEIAGPPQVASGESAVQA